MNPVLRVFTKLMSGILYFLIFAAVSIVITLFAMLVITFLGHTFDFAVNDEIVSMSILTVLLFLSGLLSRDAANNLAEGNCLFFEAIKIAIMRQKIHISCMLSIYRSPSNVPDKDNSFESWKS